MAFRLTSILALALAATIPPVAAQNITGSIIGQVTDSTGATVAGATVTISNNATAVTAQSKRVKPAIFVSSPSRPASTKSRFTARGSRPIPEIRLRFSSISRRVSMR